MNWYLDFLINVCFQGVNIIFVLSFENTGGRTSYTRYYLPLVKIKNYNVVDDGLYFFDHPVKNNSKTYDNIQMIALGEGDDYTTRCLLDYNYFNKYCKVIAIDLSKHQAMEAILLQI